MDFGQHQRRRQVSRVLWLSLLVCGLGGYVGVKFLQISSGNELKRQERLATDEGLTIQEPPPPGNPPAGSGDAGPWMAKAMAAYEANPEINKAQTCNGGESFATDPGCQDRLARLIKLHPAVVADLEKASYARKWQMTFPASGDARPHFALTAGPNLLLDRSLLRFRAGQVGAAFSDLKRYAKLVSLLASQPNELDQLISYQMESHLFRRMEIVAGKLVGHPGLSSQLQSVFDVLGQRPSTLGLMKQSVGSALASVDSPDQSEGTQPPDGDGLRPAKRFDFTDSQLFKDRAKIKLLRLYRALFRKIGPEPINLRQTLAACNDLEVKSFRLPPWEKRVSADLATVHVYPATAINSLGYRRVIESAIRLLQLKESSGSFPATLPNFGPASIDPRTDLPLSYRRRGAGFKLWAAGQDGRNHGGVRGDRPRNNQIPDVVFEYPYRPKPVKPNPGQTFVPGPPRSLIPRGVPTHQ